MKTLILTDRHMAILREASRSNWVVVNVPRPAASNDRFERRAQRQRQLESVRPHRELRDAGLLGYGASASEPGVNRLVYDITEKGRSVARTASPGTAIPISSFLRGGSKWLEQDLHRCPACGSAPRLFSGLMLGVQLDEIGCPIFCKRADGELWMLREIGSKDPGTLQRLMSAWNIYTAPR